MEEPVEPPRARSAPTTGAASGALREAGFERVYTSDGGPAATTDWLVARRTVQRWDTAESVARMLDGTGRRRRRDKAKRWVKHWR